MCQYDVKVCDVMTLILISTRHGIDRNCGIKDEIRGYAIGVPGHRMSRFTC